MCDYVLAFNTVKPQNFNIFFKRLGGLASPAFPVGTKVAVWYTFYFVLSYSSLISAL